MQSEWLAFENYRLLVIEEWPDGPRRDAALAAVRSSIDSLVRTAPVHAGAVPFGVLSAASGEPSRPAR